MKVNLNKVAKGTPAVISPGEVKAIEQTLKLAARYGYGNLMTWLATGWTKKLKIHKPEPIHTTPYPTDWLDVE